MAVVVVVASAVAPAPAASRLSRERRLLLTDFSCCSSQLSLLVSDRNTSLSATDWKFKCSTVTCLTIVYCIRSESRAPALSMQGDDVLNHR